MKYPITLLFLIVLLTGCSSNYVGVSEPENKDFAYKQECAKLIEKEKQNITKYNDENAPYNNLSLLEIFYSTKMNSCIEGFVRVTKTELVPGKPQIFTTYVTKDILENKELKAFDLKNDYDGEVSGLK